MKLVVTYNRWRGYAQDVVRLMNADESYTPSKFVFRGKPIDEYKNDLILIFSRHEKWKIQHDIFLPRIQYLKGN